MFQGVGVGEGDSLIPWEGDLKPKGAELEKGREVWERKGEEGEDQLLGGG